MSTKKILAQKTEDLLRLFCENFSGRENVHGEFCPNVISESGKVSGKVRTVRSGATLSDYEKHLNGEVGLGINPLKKDNTLDFFALDVDDYGVEKEVIEQRLSSIDLKHLTFMSKSGGLHIYFFMRSSVAAESITEIVSEIKFFLDLKQSTEVFPKQTKLSSDEVGNWINLPYFGDSRKALILKRNNLVEVTLDHALTLISSRRTSPEEMRACFDRLPLCDAPPCLQKLYLTNAQSCLEHCRNKFLFNVGIFYKKQNSTNFETLTASLNKSLVKPIDAKELEKTVFKSLLKKDYEYTCEDDFMKTVCCEDLCRRRPFGKFESVSQNITFGQLTKINYEPPIYVWEVGGKDFIYDSEKDLCSQAIFRNLCVRHLNILPESIKPKTWTNLINKSLSEMHTEEVVEEEKLSREFVFKSALKNFFLSKVFARVSEQFISGMPYFDRKSNKLFFKLEVFVKYLNTEVAFERYSTLDVRKNLRALKVTSEKLYINSKCGSLRAWSIDPKELYDKPDEFDTFYNQLKANVANNIDLYENDAPEICFKDEDF